MKIPKFLCITRIDIPRKHTHGWEVRVQRRGVAVNNFYSDLEHGGKAKALKAAMAFRDQIIRTNPPYTRGELARMVRADNVTGVTGVEHRIKRAKRGGKIYEYEVWAAAGTPVLGKRKVKDFSVKKYGEDAKEMAIAQRLAWEFEMDAHRLEK